MVRLQYAPQCGRTMTNTEVGVLVFPDYTQDNDLWIRLQDYQHEDWETIVCLWKYYNLHLIQVIKSVDETRFENYWVDYEGRRVTLQEMIRGYVDHMELHVSQIRVLAACTESPQG